VWTIRNRLFLGQETEALDRSALQGEGITHVLNCAREIPCPFGDDFEYLHLAFSDPDVSFESQIDAACRFVEFGRQRGSVLVHCRGAVSRSPAVVLAFLCQDGLLLRDAAEELGRIVPTRPNGLFLQQIASHFGEAVDDAELERIYDLLAGGVERPKRGVSQ
jgi:predicted protein tyrosine phosphatase